MDAGEPSGFLGEEEDAEKAGDGKAQPERSPPPQSLIQQDGIGLEFESLGFPEVEARGTHDEGNRQWVPDGLAAVRPGRRAG